MYYKESFDLMTCKERKVNALFNELLSREERDISRMFDHYLNEAEYKNISMDDLSQQLSYILAQYGKIRNQIIDYYYFGSETKSYADVYGSDIVDE